MPENNANLNIILKLIDEASEQLKASIGAVKKEQEDLGNKSKKSSDSVVKGFKEANKQLKDFRATMLIAGITIGAIIATTKVWAERNQETKNAYDKLAISIKDLTAMIGSLLAPAIIAFSNLLQESMGLIKSLFETVKAGWIAVFSGITYGIQYTVAFFSALKAGVGVIEAHKIATQQAKLATEEMTNQFKTGMEQNIQSTDEAKQRLKNYNDRLNDISLLFKSGQISAQEYFDTVLNFNDKVIAQNDIIAEQTRAYIDLINEVSNTDLMNFQANLESKTQLFNTYKDLYMQGHADMFAFASEMANQFHTNMSDALSSIILGEKDAKTAMKEFGQAMVKAIVDYMVQQAVAFAVSEVMKGIILATGAATAATLAAAWAPAAAMVSLATFGANAEPAMAGMAITTATAYALATPKGMALGGEGVVTRPTLFLAGEAGRPERYSFEPLGMNTRQELRGNIYIDIKVDRPIVSNQYDIDALVEEISRRLSNEVERIR